MQFYHAWISEARYNIQGVREIARDTSGDESGPKKKAFFLDNFWQQKQIKHTRICIYIYQFSQNSIPQV